jgi:hypothetical protein
MYSCVSYLEARLIFDQTLRQYAFITSILGQSFSSTKLPAEVLHAQGESLPIDVTLLGTTKLSAIFPRLDSLTSEKSHRPSTLLTLDDLLANGTSDQEINADSGAKAVTQTSFSITVDVLSNADIVIVDQNAVPVSEQNPHVPGTTETSEDANGSDSSKEKSKVHKLEKALDVCGDIGIWVEWIRKNNK